MKEINVSTYHFEDVIRENLLYVDKTEYIYNLVRVPKGEYFFSRPRRFGKSLTVSTLDALFRGKRELFEGLYISCCGYSFEKHPVIHIDFGKSDSTTADMLSSWLKRTLDKIAAEYGVSADGESPAIALGTLIEELYAKYGRGVVILIDEYDRPVTNSLEDGEKAEQLRKQLEAFYQVIKGYEGMCRFIFLTGITKLSQMSIFSRLNNLVDLSRSEKYACMMGYTRQELESCFREYLDRAQAGLQITREALLEKLEYWYDGFRFVPGAETVYNPVSVGCFFNNNYQFRNYWYTTGTPVMLVNQARKQRLSPEKIRKAQFSEFDYDTFDIMALTRYPMDNQLLIQLMFQTGYLTIGSPVENALYPTWKLEYPNYEVRSSFEVELTSIYTDKSPQEVRSCASEIYQAAAAGDTEEMVGLLRSLFAGIAYDMQIPKEAYYQSLMYLVFRICGMEIETEQKTNIGRIDAVLRAGAYIYVIECKFNREPQQAIEQIDSRQYAQKFLMEKDKKIIGLGLSFCLDEKTRNLEEKYLEEEIRP